MGPKKHVLDGTEIPTEGERFLGIVRPIQKHCQSILCTSQENKKLSYRRGTARRALLVRSCYISRGMVVRTVSISKSDFHCNYVSILHCFRDIMIIFQSFKQVT